MNNEFKVGDRVVCIDVSGYITIKLGVTYTIGEIRLNHIAFTKGGFGYSFHRFILLSEYRKKKILSLYE